MSNKILTLVLGGGRGTRLFPLTQYRSKPAVPLAGKYRLIDIPLSNCINSGLDHIYVLTQFNSVSLHRHIRRAYVFDSFRGGFVEVLAAQQTNESSDWYQGTADAVRQHVRLLQQPHIEHVLILSGDQLYRMDYNDMLTTHKESKADVTIAALPVARDQAAGFGIMRVDDTGRVQGFLEKPKTEEDLKIVRTDPAWIDQRGIQSRGRDCLASMGIYLFNRDCLVDLLTKTDYHDFGKEIFPTAIRTQHVQMHLFDGYWEDIGTIKSFYQCNLELAHSNPPFDLSSGVAPIYTRARFLPPAQFDGAKISNSLLADGCRVGKGAIIENSVIGLRCHIGPHVTIRNSIIMGNDEYETPDQLAANVQANVPPLGIGEKTLIEGAIIDKNCRIGKGVQVRNERREDSYTAGEQAMICDGIVCVPKGTTLPDGWRL